MLRADHPLGHSSLARQIPAFGSRPNTAIVSSLNPSPIAANGSLKVNPTLEVQDHPGIFALGDVVDWKEEKQAAKGAGHLAVVVPNVVSYVEGKPLTEARSCTCLAGGAATAAKAAPLALRLRNLQRRRRS